MNTHLEDEKIEVILEKKHDIGVRDSPKIIFTS